MASPSLEDLEQQQPWPHTRAVTMLPDDLDLSNATQGSPQTDKQMTNRNDDLKGFLGYSMLKDIDWRFGNYRTFGVEASWVLNELSLELAPLSEELCQLNSELDNSKPISEDHEERRKKLLVAFQEKLPLYNGLLIQLRKIKAFETPSGRVLRMQERFATEHLPEPNSCGDFATEQTNLDFRSVYCQNPVETFADLVLDLVLNLYEKFTGKKLSVLALSRKKLQPFMILLLSLTLALFFFAPMPVLLFHALPIPSTMALIMIFQIMFMVFVATAQQPNFAFLLLVSLAYGGVMWSCASNWIPAG